MTGSKLLLLLWKDWRLALPPVVGLITLCAMAYAVQMAFGGLWRPRADFSNPLFNEHVASGALYAALMTATMGAVFGGCAFADERHDGHADFFAMLPLTRLYAVFSKLLIASSVLLIALAIHFAVALIFRGDLATQTALGWGTVLTFSLAWGLSCVLRSSSISAISALVVSSSLWFIVRPNMGSRDYLVPYWPELCLILGGAAFAGGTFVYLRRISP